MALRWLKKYSKSYDNITIMESNMDWMEGKESASLPVTEYTDTNDTVEIDLGPAPRQVTEPQLNEHEFDDPTYGMLNLNNVSYGTKNDEQISHLLDELAIENNKTVKMTWPKIETDPVSETVIGKRLFGKIFPWLFPGGIGGLTDLRDVKMQPNEWIQRLMLYRDGRFATDKIFCFYAQNFVARRQNMSLGQFYVKSFFKNCMGQEPPSSLRDLQQAVKSGNTAFLDRIQYFTHKISGSPGYWREKRSELKNWINYHIDMGNGPPLYFITLSCAEYQWPDIQRLINDRKRLANENITSQNNKKRNIIQDVNDYSIVIQEYFVERVKTFLETFGKSMLGSNIIMFDLNLHHLEVKFMLIYWLFVQKKQ